MADDHDQALPGGKPALSPAALRRKRFSLRRLGRDERGFTLVFFAVSLPALLGIVGLAIDFGQLYALDTRLANAADAAALSAASQLDRTPAAITRARDAANALTNTASFAGDRTVSLTFRFAATPNELRDDPGFTLTEANGADAAVVEVTTLRRSFSATLLQFVGAKPAQIQRRATAMSQYYACDVTPLLLCQRDPERFIATATRGRQYRLRHAPDTADGTLVTLDAAGDDTGAMTPRLLATDRPAFCYTEGMTLRTGVALPQFDDAINLRFDRYANAFGPIAPELATFPPAPNVIKGQRYNSCLSPPNAAEFNPPYHLPRDSAFRTVRPATPYDLGTGDWKTTAAYGASGSQAASALGEYVFWNHADKSPIFQGSLQTSATRYELFLKELGLSVATQANPVSTFAGALAATLPTGGPRTGPYRTAAENPEPRCYRGSQPANDARRRIIYAAIVDCANFARNATPSRLSRAIGKFFITEPSTAGQIFVEFQNLLVPADDDGKLRHVVQLIAAD
jgi:Flp pilus assembly protein TadG